MKRQVTEMNTNKEKIKQTLGRIWYEDYGTFAQSVRFPWILIFVITIDVLLIGSIGWLLAYFIEKHDRDEFNNRVQHGIVDVVTCQNEIVSSSETPTETEVVVWIARRSWFHEHNASTICVQNDDRKITCIINKRCEVEYDVRESQISTVGD